jgi:hypothetical protein
MKARAAGSFTSGSSSGAQSSVMVRITTLAVLVLPVLAIAAPAAAQDGGAQGGGERVNQVVVYGDDPCPTADGDEIVVCGRLDESERYRIPEQLRGNPNSPRNESWTARVRSVERVGRFGTDSCSPTGLGGFTGCVNQLISDARAEREQNRGTSWTNAVSDARRQRMEGFDSAAEEVEAQIARDDAAQAARQQQSSNPDDPDAEALPNPSSVRPSTDGVTATPPQNR